MRHNHGLRAQSGAAWTPALIATDLWLDAADSASITTVSGAVSQWSDKSGNGRHLVQSTAAARPLYSATGFNGKPAIDFDGSNDFLKNNSYAPAGAYTAFAVLTRDGSSANTLFLAAGSTYKEVVFIPSGGYTEISLFIGGSPGVGVSPTPSTNSSSFQLNTSHDGSGTATTDARVRVNGAEQTLAGSGAFGYAAESGFGIGIRPNQQTNPLDGRIAEFIFIEQDLSTRQRELIEGYLAHKWGLAANLPSIHPYKNAPPDAGSEYFQNVSLLLSGDGTNGAQNNTFVDSSGNGRSVTRGGDITQGSFSPYGPKSGSSYDPALHGGSAYFDGSGDFLTLGSLTSTYLSGDFTIEGWVWLENQLSQMFFNTIPHASFGISLNRDGSGKTSLYIGNGSSWLTLDFRSANPIPLYAWVHIAVVRSSNAITIYHNGVAQGTTTANMPSGYGQTAYVGTYNGALGENSKGYISDYRITRSAVYTSNFTPPTAPVSAIANTEVLLKFTNGGVIDATGNNVLETVGNAQVSTVQKKFGTGGLYFDGSGDYLHIQPSDLLTLGTGNFTVEFWVKAQNQSAFYPTAIGSAAGAWGSGAYSFQIDHQSYANKLSLYANGNESPILVSATNVCDDAWHHCAVTRKGNTWRCFIDGVLEATNTTRTDFLGSSTLATRIGFDNWNGANGYFLGYLDDLRITKGVARYTANFTPPSSAFPLS